MAWVQARDNKTPNNIVEHLLKRTTNYDLRDDNEPPSRLHDDLFLMVEPNVFRRYQPGVDPEPFHLSPSGQFDPAKVASYKAVREQRNLDAGRFAFEEELQMFLRQHPEELEPGLFIRDGGVEHRTPIGLIDLLCTDSKGDLVAIELKVAGTSDKVLPRLPAHRNARSRTEGRYSHKGSLLRSGSGVAQKARL